MSARRPTEVEDASIIRTDQILSCDPVVSLTAFLIMKLFLLRLRLMEQSKSAARWLVVAAGFLAQIHRYEGLPCWQSTKNLVNERPDLSIQPNMVQTGA